LDKIGSSLRILSELRRLFAIELPACRNVHEEVRRGGRPFIYDLPAARSAAAGSSTIVSRCRGAVSIMRAATFSTVSTPAESRGQDAGSHVVRISRLRKDYGDLEVIRNVSLSVAANEFVSILGPSGCGKSTLLMMIAGLVRQTGGDVFINGEPVTGPRREVGVVFQQPVLLPWRTVLENVLLPIEFLRLPRAKYRQRAMDLLAMVKIGDFAHHLPRQLSGGMRQRASICCALIHDPGILLMDEPFSALDAITRDDMGVELLRIWQANRKTVIFVTHSIREAAFLSDRVLVMGRRPAAIIAEVAIDLPRPRQISMMEDERFNQHVRRLRKSIEASHAL
jgi:NitT/TauT family transport system ATP-binding protein